MYYIYILKSLINGKLYKGYTRDINKRILGYNQGRVKSIKSGFRWKLIYYEGFINKTDALREEIFLKSDKGKDRPKYLLKNSTEECQSGLMGRS